MKNLIIAALAMLLAVGCGSQKTATSTAQSTPERRSQQGGPPSFAQLLTEMDANNDGKLSKSEVTGPLQNDFSKIDSNSDGFITQAEVENAPRPQRGQGPPRG